MTSIPARGSVTAHEPTAGPAGDPTPLVLVEGLSKHYQKTRALDSIDLVIHEGEFLVLLGPSGCGKTTTMRCIAGLEQPSAGSITVGGTTFYDAGRGIDVAPNKRDIGMVFQSYALWPHKSVLQNVRFPLGMQKVPRREAIARSLKILAMVGLEDFADRSITTLSGGQMQRVALARAVVGNPRLLLLDEPLSNLDAKLRVRLRHELKEFQNQLGLTTVLVTHDQDEALGLADRIVVMDHGRVAQVGTPKELYSNPREAFVADFLGMTNRVPVTLASTSEGMAFGRIAGTDIEAAGGDRRSSTAVKGAVLCFRPRSAGLIPAASARSDSRENQWSGVVVSTQYQGVGYQVRVRLDDGIIIDTYDAGSHQFQPGESCVLAVAAKDSFIFDGDET